MSGGRGNLVEETHDLVQAPIVQSGEVSTFDRSICAFRSELPREWDIAAIAVRLANQGEPEGGEPLLHRTDKPINLVMAAALHEWVNVSTILRPEINQQSLSVVGIRLISEIEVAVGDRGGVGHEMSPDGGLGQSRHEDHGEDAASGRLRLR